MTNYAVQAGRLITRNGEPFVTIHGVPGENRETYDPTAWDTFTRDAANAMNRAEAFDAMREALQGLLIADTGFLPKWNGLDLLTRDQFEAARAALALADKVGR